jgi:hypothetical protein
MIYKCTQLGENMLLVGGRKKGFIKEAFCESHGNQDVTVTTTLKISNCYEL